METDLCILPGGTNGMEQSSLKALVWFSAGVEALRKGTDCDDWGELLVSSDPPRHSSMSTAKERVAPKGENSVLEESINLGVTLATASVTFSVAQLT